MEGVLCLKDCRYTCCSCGCEDWDHLLDQVMTEVRRSLPAVYLSFLKDPSVIAQWREGCQYDFPELTDWEKDTVPGMCEDVPGMLSGWSFIYKVV
ncbi:hypothetical protein MHYP_G00189140 [Metynnis hypsauchen]